MNNTHRPPNAAYVLMIFAAFVIVVAGMSAAKAIIVPFLLAAFISIGGSPILFWLKKRKVPTWLALLIVMCGILVFLFMIPGLIGSSVNDFSSKLPFYEMRLRGQTNAVLDWLDRIGVDVDRLELNKIFNSAAVMKLVVNLLNELGGVLTNGFLILITVIFMLLEASSIPVKLRAIFQDPEASLGHVKNFADTVVRYIGIKTVISFVTGAFVTIFLTLLGVDYPLLWGLLAFILNYIPNIGSIMAAVPAVLLTIIQLGLGRALVVAIGYVVINVAMGNAIEPRLMGRRLGLSTLVVFLSLIFWGWILGPVGMLLSVPLTMTVKIALDTSEDTRWIAVLLGSEKTSVPKPAAAQTPIKDKPLTPKPKRKP
ncbi:MAG TPA: AI-2E family transporter [Deltaproteobacteria bacterium]|nr:AI-2E family transporter [Deltaproteobacteria bacterium]